jgi:hypothetical protein
MKLTNEWRERSGIIEDASFSGKAQSHRTLSRVAVACIALACAWTAWTHLSGSVDYGAVDLAEQPAPSIDSGAHPSVVANAYSRLSIALKTQARRSAAAISTEVALFDSRFSLGYPPGTFALAATVTKGDREPLLLSASA